MAAAALTARARPIGAPGSGRCARSVVAWLATRGYDGASRRSSLQWSPEQISGWLSPPKADINELFNNLVSLRPRRSKSALLPKATVQCRIGMAPPGMR